MNDVKLVVTADEFRKLKISDADKKKIEKEWKKPYEEVYCILISAFSDSELLFCYGSFRKATNHLILNLLAVVQESFKVSQVCL